MKCAPGHGSALASAILLVSVLALLIGPGICRGADDEAASRTAARKSSTDRRPLVIADDGQDPASLDPYSFFGEKTHSLVQHMCEGLVRSGPDGKIEAALAVKWRTMSPTVTEFTLRSGVNFHNGLPLTPLDVKYSIEKYLDPKTKYPGRAFLFPIVEVEAKDPDRVLIHTAIPDGLLLYRLASAVFIVPRTTYEEYGSEKFGLAPVGAGPFKFVRWIRGDRIEMEPFLDYWNKEPGLGLPLVFKFLPLERRVERLLEGSVDVVPELPGTNTLQVTQNPRTKVVKSLCYATYVASFNNTAGPLQDLRVRRALILGLDCQKLIRYVSKGNGTPLATCSFPNEFGCNPKLVPRPYDPREARRLLTEAGHGQGVKLRFLVKDTAARVMGAIAQQWKEVGVHAEFKVSDDSRSIADLRGSHWDGYLAGSAKPMGHMSFFVGIGTYSRGPFSLVKSPEFDALYEKMISTLDVEEQESLCFELDQLAYDQALLLPTFQQIRTYGLSSRVQLVPFVTGMNNYHDSTIVE